jgi:hypothetical protein
VIAVGGENRKRRPTVAAAIAEYTDDLANVRHERILRDVDAMIRTLDEIRALPTTSERS